MSLFSVGGNAGFALGPLLTTPLVLLFGLSGTLALALFPLAAARADRARARAAARARARAGRGAVSGGRDDWGAFSRLGGMIALRSGVYFGLQAFIPAYFVAELSTSEAAGNAALTLMLAMGAVGTLVGGGLVDRWGARTVLVGTQVAAAAAARRAAARGQRPARRCCSALVGFVTIASFSVTIVLGQAYLPSRARARVGHHAGAGDRARRRGGDRARRRRRRRGAAGRPVGRSRCCPIPALLLALSLPTVPPAAAVKLWWCRPPMPGTREAGDREAPLTAGPDRDAVHAAPPQRLADRGAARSTSGRAGCACARSARWRPTRPCASSSQGIDGRARVLRQQSRDTYAVRFEMLGEPALAELQRLAVVGRAASRAAVRRTGARRGRPPAPPARRSGPGRRWWA